ncbi:MAG: hypothetical protein HUJ58_03845 [Erysipelotrichaceae bacterium]|nr:hypothetical protein [Erysipelotrichaceae bacterium]
MNLRKISILLSLVLLTACNQPKEKHLISLSYVSRTSESTYYYTLEREEDSSLFRFASDIYEDRGECVMYLTNETWDYIQNAIDASKVEKWNGFNEQTEGDTDDSFSLVIVYDDGSEITADGRNSFPRYYSEFATNLDVIFETYILLWLNE